MELKKKIGRPQEVTFETICKLEDAIIFGANVSEACSFAGISRDTYYRYLKNEKVFAMKITNAKNNAIRKRVLHYV